MALNPLSHTSQDQSLIFVGHEKSEFTNVIILVFLSISYSGGTGTFSNLFSCVVEFHLLHLPVQMLAFVEILSQNNAGFNVLNSAKRMLTF